jgi:uncharacterized protein (TIGR02466 family)
MITQELLFPTPVWWQDFELDTNELTTICHHVRDEYGGQIRSNVGGYQSNDFNGAHLLTVDDELGKLANRLTEMASEIYARFEPQGTHVELANLWININNGSDYNVTHTHPGSVISGAYYVTAPEDAGKIVFCRDHSSAFNFSSVGTMQDFALGEGEPWLWNQFSYPPMVNRCIMFPAWLPHKVERSETQEERISISFNLVPVQTHDRISYGIVKKINEC